MSARMKAPKRAVPQEACPAALYSTAADEPIACTRGKGHGGSNHEYAEQKTIGDRTSIVASTFWPVR